MAQPTAYHRTRNDHATEIASDYVELVQALITEHGEARGSDLAKRLGVSHVTVSKTLTRLARDGYVTFQPYRSIFLTERGRELAARSVERHRLVLGLLLAIGVSKEAAEQDSEGMEHHASQTTLEAIAKFLETRD